MDDAIGVTEKVPHEKMEIRHGSLQTPPIVKAILGNSDTDPTVDMHKAEILNISLMEVEPSQLNEVKAAGGGSFIGVMIGYVKLGGVYAPLSADDADMFADQLKAAAADLRKIEQD
jgi:hypothetical protein